MSVSNQVVFDVSLAKSEGSYTLLVEFWENGRYENAERAAIWNLPLVFESKTYHPSDLSISLPNSSGEESNIRASISNIDGKVGNIIRKQRGEIVTRIILVEIATMTALSDTKNSFRLEDISITLEKVIGSVKSRFSIEEPFPPQRFPRNILPGTWYIQS